MARRGLGNKMHFKFSSTEIYAKQKKYPMLYINSFWIAEGTFNKLKYFSGNDIVDIWLKQWNSQSIVRYDLTIDARNI